VDLSRGQPSGAHVLIRRSTRGGGIGRSQKADPIRSAYANPAVSDIVTGTGAAQTFDFGAKANASPSGQEVAKQIQASHGLLRRFAHANAEHSRDLAMTETSSPSPYACATFLRTGSFQFGRTKWQV
jgi:hypothetical protein